MKRLPRAIPAMKMATEDSDLTIEIAVARLKSKDDRKIEDHACQACGEDGVGNRLDGGARSLDEQEEHKKRKDP